MMIFFPKQKDKSNVKNIDEKIIGAYSVISADYM